MNMADDSTFKGRIRSLTGLSLTKSGDNTLERTNTIITIGRLTLRGQEDDLPEYVALPDQAVMLTHSYAETGGLPRLLSLSSPRRLDHLPMSSQLRL